MSGGDSAEARRLGMAEGVVILSLLSLRFRCLRKFETDIGPSAEPHEPEQGRVELRHREIAIYILDKNNSQYYRPDNHLKAVKADAPPSEKMSNSPRLTGMVVVVGSLASWE